ncbi:Mannitol-1-phosphate 5-dehydrogenase [Lactobacillus delbrueckii subsp. bulgaricus CNCM I-1519]
MPIQHNEDPLFVSVEDFKEWVIDESQMKNPEDPLGRRSLRSRP